MTSTELFDTPYTTKESVKELSKKLDEPDWLLERRLKAYDEYKSLPFDKDTLFYKYTSFRDFDPDGLEPSWKSVGEVSIKEDTIAMKELDADLIETESGVTTKIPEELVNKGVIFDSLHNLIERNEKKARELVEKATPVSENFDKLGSLSRAFATNITILYVPEKVEIDEPLVKITSIGNQELATFSEIISVYGNESRASLIDMYQRSPGESKGDQMYSSIETSFIGGHADIKSTQIQDWNLNTLHMMSRVAHLEEYANYRALTHLQGGYMNRINSNMMLEGNGSEGYDLFVSFGNSKQRFDVKSELHHVGESTIGQTHARQVMMENAESILRGLIVIPESGIHADSWLTSQGMTLDSGKVTAVPALQIDQNDVMAAHAASVEPLNEDLLFYLGSRGIPKKEAKEMIVKGYFEYVLKLLEDNNSIEVCREYLNKKWEITQE